MCHSLSRSLRDEKLDRPLPTGDHRFWYSGLKFFVFLKKNDNKCNISIQIQNSEKYYMIYK